MLNQSSNHHYFRYCKHNPTGDIITSNATTCLLCYMVTIPYQICYTIDIY